MLDFLLGNTSLLRATMPVSVTSKGQVTIPIAVRRALGIRAGSKVKFSAEGDGARLEVVRPARPSLVEEGAGMLKHKGKPVRVADMDPARLLARKRK